MKSIMHKKDGTCYLCMRLNQDYSIKPYVEEHHTIGKMAVHQNADIAAGLKEEAQLAFEKQYPDLDFMSIFQKIISGGIELCSQKGK